MANAEMPNGKWQVLRFFVAAALSVAATFTAAAHDRIATKVTWEREIGPIVRARCVSCHDAGGRAPMPLTTYDEARPWARAIREEVLTRRMPRWHAVRGYGDFVNDPSLSAFEIALITAWVDGGAPRTLPGTTTLAVVAPGAPPAPPRTRHVTVPCTARTLPPGRVVALRPSLGPGAALRVDVARDGWAQPLLWVRNFDPGANETYWLRTPLTTSPTMRVTMTGGAPCALTVLLAARTAQ